MCDKQSLRSACTYAQSDQSLCVSLEYSMTVKLLIEHHLEFLSLKGGGTGSFESTLVKMPHCWKLHVAAHIRMWWYVSMWWLINPMDRLQAVWYYFVFLNFNQSGIDRHLHIRVSAYIWKISLVNFIRLSIQFYSRWQHLLKTNAKSRDTDRSTSALFFSETESRFLF